MSIILGRIKYVFRERVKTTTRMISSVGCQITYKEEEGAREAIHSFDGWKFS